MNIVKKLTLRQMTLNKKKTLMTMLSIVIAVAMITAISVMGNSVMTFMGRMAEENGYKFHTKIGNFQYEDKKIIFDNLNVNKYALAKVEADYIEVETEDGEGIIKPYEYIAENVNLSIDEQYDLDSSIRVLAVNDNYYEMMNIKLSEGKYPTNDKEILLPESMLKSDEEEYGEKAYGYNVGDIYKLGDNEYIVSGFIMRS